ncbi:MAG: S-methyl-5-thioribose-1-phosphate isomerase [Dehalococcoidia bacterium]|nr:S-methyl-5-thioribose-1-phosphate isomerase [Dehalococcoidia bacterium]
MGFRTLEWDASIGPGGALRLLDQTQLPHRVVYMELTTPQQVAHAIKTMQVRGAPAIGVAAAFGLALGASSLRDHPPKGLLARLQAIRDELAATRPTAVNLAWALDKVMQAARRAEGSADAASIAQAALAEAQRLAEADVAANRALGRHGAALLPDGARVLTHCNAGALATVGYGTALGVIRAAVEQGKRISVWADETRPRLQGAALTAWELMQDNIPVTLISDTAAGHLMRRGQVDCVVVGADRIAANGDVANKIGTYQVAVLAKENGLPFYVAAPTSTIDLSLPDGDRIPIEERGEEEVTAIQGARIAPEGVRAANPAFDVTPHRYVSAIITEKGVVREPYTEGLKLVMGEDHGR